MEGYAAILDVTQYPARFKHAAIFAVFETLAPGLTMVISNDHDPVPLRYQFEAERSGEFSWNYLEQGPSNWKVAITRKGA